MRHLAALLLCASLACAQNPSTAVFPAGVATDSDLLVATNNARSTLSAAIGATDTSFALADATRFTAPLALTIDGEVIRCAARSGNTLSGCTRGFDGSTAAAHAVNATTQGNMIDRHYNQAAAEIKSIESVLFGTISTRGAGAACDGVTVDDTAINAALVTAINGPTLRVNCTSAVKNIIIPTSTPNAHVRIQFDPGARWICTNSDGTDCVAAISTAFSNPVYEIEGMSLTGPDPASGVGAAPCSTTTGGNGLRISGAATPLVRIHNIRAVNFCASGKAGVWLDNVENGSLRDGRITFNDIGLKLTSAPNANSFDTLLIDQNASQAVTMTGATSNTFTNLTIQSNAKGGMYLYGSPGNTFNSPHFEHNNIAGTAATYALALYSAAAYGVSLGNTFNAPYFASSGDNILLTSASGYATSANTFIGGNNTSGGNPLLIEDTPYTFANSFLSGFISNLNRVSYTNGAGQNDFVCPALYSGAGTGNGACSFPGNGVINSPTPLNFMQDTGTAANAVIGAGDAAIAASLIVTVKLAHTLQAGSIGPNTFNYNGSGAKLIMSHYDSGSYIAKGYSANTYITLMYDVYGHWVDLSQ